MLLRIVVLALAVRLGSAEPTLENLRVAQEGFEGLISLSFEHAADAFNVSVTNANGTTVEFTGEQAVPAFTTTIIMTVTIRNPVVGAIYNLTVIPYRYTDDDTNGEIPGPPTSSVIKFQGRDEKISRPTNFRHVQLDRSENELSWNWINSNESEQASDESWFFVEYCQQSRTLCAEAVTQNNSILLDDVPDANTYYVQVFAHTKGTQLDDPVRTSEPLKKTIRIRTQHHAPTGTMLDLEAIQEGFDGRIGLHWNNGYSGRIPNYFDISVTYANNTPVNYTGPARIDTEEHFEKFLTTKPFYRPITITAPSVGATYKITVTAISKSKKTEIPGPPSTSNVTFQGSGDAISTPTNFRYTKQTPYSNLLRWNWTNSDTGTARRTDQVWFFIEYCRPNRVQCQVTKVSTTTVTLDDLVSRTVYDVRIVAHMKGRRDTDSPRTSAVLIATMETRSIDPPPALSNLRVAQEGFDGHVSLFWDVHFADKYNITVLDTNSNTTVKFTDKQPLIQIEKPIVGVKYRVTVTPVRTDEHGTDIPGPSASARVIYSGRESAIPTPTNFQYAQLSLYFNAFAWDWSNTDGDVHPNDSVWFFVQYCARGSTRRDTFTTRKRSADTNGLHSRSTYDVWVVAHLKTRRNGKKQTRISEPLKATMESLSEDWPGPTDVKIEISSHSPTLDRVAYLVSWSIPSSDRLLGISIRESFDEFADNDDNGLGEQRPKYIALMADGRAQNISVELEYDRIYDMKLTAYYTAGLNRTGMSRAKYVQIKTISGPSNPVRHLKVSQEHFSEVVRLKWQHPRRFNGPLDFYQILVTDETGNDVLTSINMVDRNQTSATVKLLNVTFGALYEVAVTPVHAGDDRNGADVVGQTAIVGIILVRFPWATLILIILFTIAAIVLAAFLLLKVRGRRKSEDPPIDASTMMHTYNGQQS